MSELVPELRFPGFDGEWKSQKLGKFFEEYREKSTEPDQFEVLTSARYGLIPQIEYYGEGRIVDRDNVGFNIIPPGYLTYRSRSDDRRFFFNENTSERTGIISIYYPVFRVRNGSNKFFIELLGNKKNYIGKFSVGTSQTVLSLNELKQIRLPIPTPAEQTKIGAFLDIVLRKITLLRKKRTALRDYKCGLMQRLFSGVLRFTRDDGSPFPDWEERRLGDIANRTIEKNKDFGISRVLTNSATQGIIDQGDYFDKDIANADNIDGYYIVRRGDFVYNPRISVSAPVGPIKRNNLADGVMSPLYTVFRFNISDTDFFSQYFDSMDWHRYMRSVANYGARHDRMAINTDDFMNLPLPYPHSDEQRKIADVLTALDVKIDALARKITEIETFKKGLLQKLFV